MTTPSQAPVVSVLMTAYNRQPYIAEAIESVLAQTFTDFELIIVDDSSKDGTADIARRFRKDSRVSVCVNERNLGDYPNRNRAAGFARGRYLKYLDADDLMYPHCLEMMVHQMELFPEAGLGFTKDLGERRLYPLLATPAQVYRMEFLGWPGLLCDGPSFAIYRRSLFQELGGFSRERVTSDTEFAFRAAARSAVLFTAPNLVFYRQHPAQESAWGAREAEVKARYFRIRRDALLHSACPLTKREAKRALVNFIGLYLREVAREMVRGRLGHAAKCFELSGLGLGSLPCALRPSRFPHRESSPDFGFRTLNPNWKCHPRSAFSPKPEP